MPVSFLRTILAVMVLLVPAVALAQGVAPGGFDPSAIDKMTASLRQIPLTEDSVDRFIASYKDMRATAAKFPQTELPNTQADLSALPKDKREAMEAVATAHGFKNLDEWADVGSSIMMSYAYALQGKHPGALAEAVELNVAQAEHDETMSDEQRQKTVEQIREVGAKLARLEPLKENFELIERMKAKIAPLMESTE